MRDSGHRSARRRSMDVRVRVGRIVGGVERGGRRRATRRIRRRHFERRRRRVRGDVRRLLRPLGYLPARNRRQPVRRRRRFVSGLHDGGGKLPIGFMPWSQFDLRGLLERRARRARQSSQRPREPLRRKLVRRVQRFVEWHGRLRIESPRLSRPHRARARRRPDTCQRASGAKKFRYVARTCSRGVKHDPPRSTI